MKKFLKRMLVIVLLLAGVGISTSANYLDKVSSTSNNFVAGVSSNFDIKLNEIMPNPDGDDNAPMPDGEWVELYNNGNWPIDVNGWYLYDAHDYNELPISSSNVSGGSTIIPAHGFLTVYRNGDTDFSLNNAEAGDIVRLYDGEIGTGTQIDLYSYNGPIPGWVFARIPDGIGSWVASSTPTPGGSNV